MAARGCSDNDSQNKKGLKRKWSTTSTSNDSTCDSAIPTNEIPKETSLWKEEHLDLLCIHTNFKAAVCPTAMITESLIRILGVEKYASYAHYKSQDPTYRKIKDCIESAFDIIYLDCDDIDDVSSRDIEEIRAELSRWWQTYFKQETAAELKEYCMRLHVHGQLLADQLECMVLCRKRGGDLAEGKFQQLFMHYLMMFSLTVFGFSNVEPQAVQIGRKTVSSIPDILIVNANTLNAQEVIGVVGVKCDCLKCLKKKPKEQRSCMMQHCESDTCPNISSELLAQHGGELVASIPSSIFEDKGIFGIIVQGTKVSFTALVPQEKYIQCLKAGDLEKKECQLIVSRECNFLSKAGRQNLLEPLMEFVFLHTLSSKRKMKMFLS